MMYRSKNHKQNLVTLITGHTKQDQRILEKSFKVQFSRFLNRSIFIHSLAKHALLNHKRCLFDDQTETWKNLKFVPYSGKFGFASV